MRNPNYYLTIRALMMARFRQDWERIESGDYNKNPEELLQYRRSLRRQAIDGTYVKSFGEKVIANFLFEHDLEYTYERFFKWSDGGSYHPDFTLKYYKIVIEYFGLQGDPDYDVLSDGKRRYWQKNPSWRFLEFSPDILRNEGADAFCAHLKRSLEACGVKCDRLSEDEIWRRIKDRPHTIYRFTRVVVGFIQRCRKRSLSSEQLAEIVQRHSCENEIERQFLDLVQVFYRSYLEKLRASGQEDFDGLMQKAAQLVDAGKTLFHRLSGSGDLKQLRYVFIDEYQDFSDLFYRLISALRAQNPSVQFFCVGDDWQAINGFAGSDLSFYQKFTQYFPAAAILTIATNYRSSPAIVDVSNNLMRGLGTPARAHKQTVDHVQIGDLKSFQSTPEEKEKHQHDTFTPAVLRLVKRATEERKKVVLLSRANTLPWYIHYQQEKYPSDGKTLDRFLKLIHAHLPEASREDVSISTAHSYKGLDKEMVILLDAIPRHYPLLHPDWIFTRVLGDSIEQMIAEERRLFYVALTRAIEQLVILTEGANRSPFLNDLEKHRRLPVLDWSSYLPTESITIKVGN
jgi:DNA helicase IV